MELGAPRVGAGIKVYHWREGKWEKLDMLIVLEQKSPAPWAEQLLLW